MSQTSDISDLHCIGCGYLLGGLGIDGKCPECGLKIEASQSGALFDFCPRFPRPIVRSLRTIAGSDLLGLVLLVAACGWAIGGVGGDPFAILHLAVVGVVSIARSLMILHLWRHTRSYWHGDEPGQSTALSYSAVFRIATAVITVGFVAAGAHVADCVAVAVLWGVFGGIEAAARLAWMRTVGRALEGPRARRLTMMALTALISLLLGAVLGGIGVLGILSTLMVLMLSLPFAILAFLCFEITMFGATIACADVVSEWHAARVNP